jgi:hypothetical protein
MMGVAADLLRPKAQLLAENALLRQQLIVLKRSVKRPKLRIHDRLILVALSRVNSAWKDALYIVQPDTSSQMASTDVQARLVEEVPAKDAEAESRPGCHCAPPANLASQPALGRRTDPR